MVYGLIYLIFVMLYTMLYVMVHSIPHTIEDKVYHTFLNMVYYLLHPNQKCDMA